MRTIKFRGKTDNGEWIKGNLVRYREDDGEEVTCIVGDKRNEVDACLEFVPVDPNTVGQFTSLFDKNHQEIYEGDVLMAGDERTKLEVRFVRGVFAFLWDGNLDDEFPTGSPTHEWAKVVGNIHDNPKLLKRH